MAINPMQRKANNSFILGILITLLITGLIIGFLIMQLVNLNKEIENMNQGRTSVYALKNLVKSGDMITADMLKKIEVDSGTIPKNAITAASDLSNYSLCDEDGRAIKISSTDSEGNYKYVIEVNGVNVDLNKDTSTEEYYYNRRKDNGIEERVYVKLSEQPLIAKVDLDANTLLTSTTIARGELIKDDLRIQEYNIITLPTQLTTGDIIDIRLRLPSGQDYIVLSHKEVEIPIANGVESLDCIWLNLSEIETLTMSNAIVEAYKIEGAKLYATKYVEAGNQEAAVQTYLPSQEVINLIKADSNIVEIAKNELASRLGNYETIRKPINSAGKDEDAVIDGVQDEIQRLQVEREKYLESLGM